MITKIPEHALEEEFLAGTGKGGQNVNKVASTVQLKMNIYALGLETPVFHRLKKLAGKKLNKEGQIVLIVRDSRNQSENRKIARQRLAKLLEKAHHRPVRRKKTRVSRNQKAKRMDNKSRRSEVKQLRGKVTRRDY